MKTDAYTKEQIGKVVQLRASVEGLKLSTAVVEKLSAIGENSSLRLIIFFLLDFNSVLFFSGTLYNC